MGSHHRLRMIVSRICTLFGALCAGGLAVAGEPGTTAWSIDASAAKRSASAHLAVYDTLPAGSVSRLTAVSGPKQDTSGNGHLPAHRSPPVIELPNGEHFTPAWSSRIEHADGNVSFVAVDAAGAGLLQMTMGPDASFARISSPSGNYRFESFGAEARLVDVGHAGIMLSSIDDGASGDRLPAAAKRSALAKAGETAIDVLFLYSDGFAARYPGSAAVTRIHYFQAIANQALANSAVSAVVRVAGTMQSAYPDSEGSNGLALDRMRQALAGQTPHPAFANLPAQRQGAGADVVVLLRPHDIETRGSCGIARFPNGSPAEAVHVVSDGFSSWSLCDDDVFTHELGHNLGAEHQFGASSPNPGFGTAHVRLGRLHTVMGSFGTGNPNRRFGLQRFSNPGRPCGGAPCGAAGSSDNARRISENLALVSGYANAAASTPAEQAPPATDPDPDGDGAPESLDAFPFDARYQSDRDNDGVADNIDAFPDQAGEWLDSDGDGTGDNADTDDDNDGIGDAQDAFPTDPSEQADSDQDGVGDHADAFPLDAREFADSDLDGTGDRADADADGDGAADFSTDSSAGGFDLLVTSSGNDRILRFDGSSGLFANVEVAEHGVPVAFGQQSNLAWLPQKEQLLALVSSELRGYDRRHTADAAEVLVQGFQDGASAAFPAGFPVAMAVIPGGDVVVAETGTSSLLRFDPFTRRGMAGGAYGEDNIFTDSPRASALTADGHLWFIDRNAALTEVDAASGFVLRSVFPNQAGAPVSTDPTALATHPDGATLLVADGSGDSVRRVDPNRAGASTYFVQPGAGGLDRPTGLTFGPDGHLYVSSAGTHSVLRFDGSTGAFIDVFTTAPQDTLVEPRSLLFVPRVTDRFPTDATRRFLPVSGGWYNPQRSGHGFDLQRAGDQLSLIWYTYETDGTPTWYLALGTLAGDRWEADLLRFTRSGDTSTSAVVGDATLLFADERHATFSWTLPEGNGSEPVQPLYVGNSAESQFPTSSWYDPSESGWGLSVTRQGDVRYLMAFVYDAAGEPYWFIGAALDSDDPNRFDMQWFSGPDRCPSCTGAEDAIANPGGTLRFAPVDLDGARVESAMSSPAASWQRDPLDFVRLTDSPTDVDGDPLPSP